MTTHIDNGIYTTTAIREFEHRAVGEYGLTEFSMMQHAGEAAWQVLKTEWPQAKKIKVICGKGNNGGDGYILASLASLAGLDVEVFYLGEPSQLTAVAQLAWQSAERAHVLLTPWHSNADLQCDVIVDAMLGIGLTNTINSEVAVIIEKINQANRPVLAIDVPSGLIADTGSIAGNSVIATHTITFIGLKLGLVTGDGVSVSGKISVDKINMPESLYHKIAPFSQRVVLDDFQSYLVPRLRNAHKGNFGHVLIVGGDEGMAGAVILSAEAALRAGAGLVSVATRPEHVNAVVAHRPEIMAHGISSSEQLAPLLSRATVIAIGPGLGQQSWGKSLWQAVLKTQLPLIVDADALNLLALAPSTRANWILTPHPGELARLNHCDVQHIQQNRWQQLHAACERYQGVLVLKGAGTLIMSQEKLHSVCGEGNPGMASAGMGDVLTGVIAALIAQGFPLALSAQIGVCAHARAGDIAARLGQRGLIASDVIQTLIQVMH
ncbi:MAG: NAD(P)H-hydrate dehydratase [Legionellales bacterium]|nr:NAD(P)H-hydrate dehydratase [Legionellales bacterium]